MNADATLSRIEDGRIIAILRGDFQAREVEIAATLLDAGVTAVEVTLNSADAIGAIRRIAHELGSRMAVGAGTVLRADEVAQVADIGAAFIVSPNRDLRVISATKTHGLVSIPGCLTPSEILEALDAGADAVKLFPAVALGPAFVKAVRGPLGAAARLVPTGGINPDNARQYLAAGAWGLGIGSELVSADVLASGGIARLGINARTFMASVRTR